MIKIKLDCSSEVTSQLKNYLTTINLIISEELHNPSLLIKEVKESSDIEYLHKVKDTFCNHIICIVGDEKYIFDVIAMHPLGIWRKDNLQEDYQNILAIIRNITEKNSIIVEFQSNANKIIVDTKDIIYIESFGHYLTIHTVNASFRIREKISTILNTLKDYGFIQIHKSYVINKNHICFINAGSCELSCNISIPIGKKYKCIDLR